ncbi:hypothetical protein SK128_023534, partial [Halocaridina rubra]
PLLDSALSPIGTAASLGAQLSCGLTLEWFYEDPQDFFSISLTTPVDGSSSLRKSWDQFTVP